MAYQGYLIKVGEYQIPYKFINAETYKGKKNTQDIDSYRDGDGKLHRNVLSHKPGKVEFETPPNIKSQEFAQMIDEIEKNHTEESEEKFRVSYFLPQKNEYVEQEMYMPDIEVNVKCELNGELIYNPTRIAFIGY